MKRRLIFVLALVAAAFAAPTVDLSSLGNIGVVGSFEGLQLLEDSVLPPSFDVNRASVLGYAGGALSKLAETDAGGNVTSFCELEDGRIVLGGNFTTVNDVAAAHLALISLSNATVTALTAPGPIQALYCSGDSIYMGTTSGVALYSLAQQALLSEPLPALNGSVNSIARTSDALIFGGDFTATFVNSTNSTTTTSSTGINSNFSASIGSSLAPVTLYSADSVYAGPTTYRSGFGRPENVFCPGAVDGPASSWLLVDHATGVFTARWNQSLTVRGVRLGNTFFNGRGTKNFTFVSIPDDEVLTLHHAVDPTDVAHSARAACTNCQLSNDSSVAYEDFLFDKATQLSGFQLNINTHYGAAGGLHLLQLLSEGAFVYASNSSINSDQCGSTLEKRGLNDDQLVFDTSDASQVSPDDSHTSYAATAAAHTSDTISSIARDRTTIGHTGRSAPRYASTRHTASLRAPSVHHASTLDPTAHRITARSVTPDSSSNYVTVYPRHHALGPHGSEGRLSLARRGSIAPRAATNFTAASTYVTTTGNWNETFSASNVTGIKSHYITAAITSTTNRNASVTFHTSVVQQGYYTVQVVTPGCSYPNDCDARARVTATVEVGDNTTRTTFRQNNEEEHATRVYHGWLNDSLAVTLAVADNFTPSGTAYMVANLVSLVAQSTNGSFTNVTNTTTTLQSLYEYTVDLDSGDGMTDTNSTLNTIAQNVTGTLYDVHVEDEWTAVAGAFAYGDAHNFLLVSDGEATAPAQGLDGPVYSLAYLNGSLYAAGDFAATADASVSGLDGLARLDITTRIWAAVPVPADIGVAGAVTHTYALGDALLATGRDSFGLYAYTPQNTSWEASEFLLGNLSRGLALKNTSTLQGVFAGNVDSLLSSRSAGGASLRYVKGLPVLESYGLTFQSANSTSNSSESTTSESAVRVRRARAEAENALLERAKAADALYRRSGDKISARADSRALVKIKRRIASLLDTNTSSVDNSSMPVVLDSNITIPTMSSIPTALSLTGSAQILTGTFDASYGMVLGGRFTTTSGVQNIGLYSTLNNSMAAFADLTVDGTVLATYIYGEILFAAGEFTTDSGAQGMVAYNLTADAPLPIAAATPTAYTGQDVTVSALVPRPGYGGQFAVSGSFESIADGAYCHSICLAQLHLKSGTVEYDNTGGGVLGAVAGTAFGGARSEYLYAVGNFFVNNATQAYVAKYAIHDHSWSSIANSSALPGPATAVAVSNHDSQSVMVAGVSDTTSVPYIQYYDGKTWTDLSDTQNGTLTAGSVIENIMYVPLSATNSAGNSSIIPSNRALLVTGKLAVDGSTLTKRSISEKQFMAKRDTSATSSSFSSLIYDGSALYPHMASTDANGDPGVIKQLVYSSSAFYLHIKKYLSPVIVVLICVAIALGLVLLIVLLGVLIVMIMHYHRDKERERKRREYLYGDQSAPSLPPIAINETKIASSYMADISPKTATAGPVRSAESTTSPNAPQPITSNILTNTTGLNRFLPAPAAAIMGITSLMEINDLSSEHSFGDDEDANTDSDHILPTADSMGVLVAEEDDEDADIDAAGQKKDMQARVRYSFTAEHPGELTVKTGEDIIILEASDTNWYLVANSNGERGLMPATYLV